MHHFLQKKTKLKSFMCVDSDIESQLAHGHGHFKWLHETIYFSEQY